VVPVQYTDAKKRARQTDMDFFWNEFDLDKKDNRAVIVVGLGIRMHSFRVLCSLVDLVVVWLCGCVSAVCKSVCTCVHRSRRADRTACGYLCFLYGPGFSHTSGGEGAQTVFQGGQRGSHCVGRSTIQSWEVRRTTNLAFPLTTALVLTPLPLLAHTPALSYSLSLSTYFLRYSLARSPHSHTLRHSPSEPHAIHTHLPN
jgi:hypothetical protein